MIAVAIAIWLLIAPKPWVAAAQIRGKTDTLDYVRIYGWIAGADQHCPSRRPGRDMSVVGRTSAKSHARFPRLRVRVANPSMVLAPGGRRDGSDVRSIACRA